MQLFLIAMMGLVVIDSLIVLACCVASGRSDDLMEWENEGLEFQVKTR